MSRRTCIRSPPRFTFIDGPNISSGRKVFEEMRFLQGIRSQRPHEAHLRQSRMHLRRSLLRLLPFHRKYFVQIEISPARILRKFVQNTGNEEVEIGSNSTALHGHEGKALDVTGSQDATPGEERGGGEGGGGRVGGRKCDITLAAADADAADLLRICFRAGRRFGLDSSSANSRLKLKDSKTPP